MSIKPAGSHICALIVMAGPELQYHDCSDFLEEEAKHIKLLTLERRSMAESLAQYILKRQATLAIVVIRSRNLSIELIGT